MRNLDYERRIDSAKQRAHGRWTEILREYAADGADARLLKRRNMPCPLCGGDDRFQYTDKFGEGNYHCRHCGPGGGFKLLQALTGWDFNTALKKVEAFLGIHRETVVTRPSEPSPERMKRLAQRIWNEARPIVEGDEAHRYLCGRGLSLPNYPRVLRCHPALGYYEKDGEGKSRLVAEYPALLACVQGQDGRAITLHRTYLQDGRKAPVRDARKLLSAGINGGAVRLFEATDLLGAAEGVETALAVYLDTGKPLWAAINASNLEKLWIPNHVRYLSIYGDNDANSSFAGQASAYALARRVVREKLPDGSRRRVQVFIPQRAGADWRDVWEQRAAKTPPPPRPARPRRPARASAVPA